MDVSRVTSAGQTCHGCQVSAVAAHDLDDEDPTLRSGRRLADPVADLGDLVQSGVAPEREVGAGNVVADGGRQDDDRDSEFGKLISVLGHEECRVEGLEPPYEQKSVNVFVRESLRHSFEFSVGKSSFRSKSCSAGVSPSVDGFPGE